MKKNRLLLSSLIFTAAIGQVAWAAPLNCAYHSDERGCFQRSHFLELDLETKHFEYRIEYNLRPGCFRWPPAPYFILGEARGALQTHLGVILRAENTDGSPFTALVTGNPLEVSFDDGKNIYPMNCR